MGKLLAIAAKSPDVDVFADSMVAALSSTTLPETASLDEMKLLLEQVLHCFGFGAQKAYVFVVYVACFGPRNGCCKGLPPIFSSVFWADGCQGSAA